MAFAQLTYRESLRDIETCLGAVGGKLAVVAHKLWNRSRNRNVKNRARDSFCQGAIVPELAQLCGFRRWFKVILQREFSKIR